MKKIHSLRTSDTPTRWSKLECIYNLPPGVRPGGADTITCPLDRHPKSMILAAASDCTSALVWNQLIRPRQKPQFVCTQSLSSTFLNIPANNMRSLKPALVACQCAWRIRTAPSTSTGFSLGHEPGMCEAKILEVSNNRACFIVWSKADIYANVVAGEYHYRELRPLYSDLLEEGPVKATDNLFVRNPSWTCGCFRK